VPVRAATSFEQARQRLHEQVGDSEIWTLLLLRPFGGAAADRLIYYDTVARKDAALDLFQAVVLLRKNRGAEARRTVNKALGSLGRAPSDVEVVHRALNDLARLEAHAPLSQEGKALRATLETWAKQRASG